ncbi:MAG: sugar ABC transporter ATP-binding protein [Verrucomicrobia bacterium]|nr:sugar ABC transporter ATP-binding protein [Verrucomicrobiota bacterium]
MKQTETQPRPLARMRGIAKRFGPVTVLHGVDLDIYPGEVLVLAGENGAGKSTLIKILGGVYSDYEGSIELGGRLVRPATPIEAARLGVAVIFQELSLAPTISVADNLFLGRHPGRAGFVDARTQRRAALRALGELGVEIDPDALVGELPMARQQLVEIAKALSRDARLIVMDEPTSALNQPEVERLFRLIDRLKAQNRGIVYITHKMEEIEVVADRIAVLRDGRLIGSAPARELSRERLIEWMVGRRMDTQFPPPTGRLGEERLRLEKISVPDPRRPGRWAVRDVSLQVRAGEIVGLAGLQGSGVSELLQGIFGAYGRRVAGRLWIDGKPARISSPRASIRRGMALLTNDRQATGLIPPMSVLANICLADLPRLSPGGWRRPRLEKEAAERRARETALRAPSLEMEARQLSGGNQQKVVLAKWLQTEPKALLLDEPTRGIDVGAKREIYLLLRRLAAEGIGILLITSELPELIGLSDRALVFHRGEVRAELDKEQLDPNRILAAAMGAEETEGRSCAKN